MASRGGYSLAEFLACAAVACVAAAVALVDVLPARRSVTLDGAARHLALALRAARTDAVRQGRAVAVQFLVGEGETSFRTVADGNANGVRAVEIASGVDPVVRPVRRLADDFPGVRIGIGRPCPGIDTGPPVDSASPGVQFGTSELAVFTPVGTAASGTVYLTNGLDTYAVRVLGTTGRTRVLRCDAARGAWVVP